MSPTVEFNKFEIADLNYHNIDELAEVAKIYACVPKNWDLSFSVAAEMLEKYQQWLVDKKDNLKCLLAKDKDINDFYHRR